MQLVCDRSGEFRSNFHGAFVSCFLGVVSGTLRTEVISSDSAIADLNLLWCLEFRLDLMPWPLTGFVQLRNFGRILALASYIFFE